VAAGHEYFGRLHGLVYEVDLTSRHVRGQFRVQAAQKHRELLTDDDHLNAAAIYGPLEADGKPNSTLDATIIGVHRLLQRGSILSSPSRRQRIVYIASADRAVYALD
jgi:hypothetical protein